MGQIQDIWGHFSRETHILRISHFGDQSLRFFQAPTLQRDFLDLWFCFFCHEPRFLSPILVSRMACSDHFDIDVIPNPAWVKIATSCDFSDVLKTI